VAGIERIAPSFRGRVWGSTGLSPWFPEPEQKIGEVWLDAGEGHPLVKFLFTTEKLSIQVHPDDDYALEHENTSGKTEMWHILRTAPGASVGIGFRRPVTREQLRSAALDGTIEGLMNWIPVRPGDTLFVPAGAVHAIGAGLTLCEIQQRSDVTYRVFDYGRDRELHLDKAMEVAALGPVNGRTVLPVRSPFFHTERIVVNGTVTVEPVEQPSVLVVLQGEGLVGDEPFLQGEAFRVDGGTPVTLRGQATVLRTYRP